MSFHYILFIYNIFLVLLRIIYSDFKL